MSATEARVPEAGNFGSLAESSEMLDLRHGSFSARVRVRRMTPAKSRGRVVCLHGLASEASEFRILAEHLAGEGLETIYADWIGHGDSQRFADAGDYLWDRYVKMVLALDAVFGDATTHYVGNSWGAAILFLAVVGGKMRLRSCTFIDLPVRTDAALAGHSTYVSDLASLSFPDFESAERYLAERRPVFAIMPPRLAAYYRASRFRIESGVVRFAMDPKVAGAGLAHAARKFNLTPYMHRLNAPALFLYGRDSAFRQPKLFELICRTQRNIAYYDDIDAGHPPSLQEYDHIAPILAFLRRVG
jgi:pimeloyl-ACP methyl ester carboxylesterase